MNAERGLFILLTLVFAGLAAACSYLLSVATARLATSSGAVDMPTGGRKIHTKPIPLFGGVGIAIAILFAVFIASVSGFLPGVTSLQILGFAVAVAILCIGGALDDLHSRPPGVQILFPILAAVAVIVSGTGIIQVTSMSGSGAFSLRWWSLDAFNISLPSDLITLLWLLFAAYSTKFLDGLDGLVAGMAAIGAGMVGALTLSPAYFQPGVAILAASVGGSFLGFLPRNIHPAKQFLGEAGSTLAGFSLGFLAIVSSAKIAVALAVLAIPLADAAIVVFGRVRRGAKPWVGDETHLHFRLLRAGIPYRTSVFLLWAASFTAGVIALGLQTRGKIFLVVALIMLTLVASWMLNRMARRAMKSDV